MLWFTMRALVPTHHTTPPLNIVDHLLSQNNRFKFRQLQCRERFQSFDRHKSARIIRQMEATTPPVPAAQPA
jgi:hypothetical protein